MEKHSFLCPFFAYVGGLCLILVVCAKASRRPIIDVTKWNLKFVRRCLFIGIMLTKAKIQFISTTDMCFSFHLGGPFPRAVAEILFWTRLLIPGRWEENVSWEIFFFFWWCENKKFRLSSFSVDNGDAGIEFDEISNLIKLQ